MDTIYRLRNEYDLSTAKLLNYIDCNITSLHRLRNECHCTLFAPSAFAPVAFVPVAVPQKKTLLYLYTQLKRKENAIYYRLRNEYPQLKKHG